MWAVSSRIITSIRHYHASGIICHRSYHSCRAVDIDRESAVVDTTFPFVMLTFMENLLSSAQPFGRLVDILEESASCHCYNFLVVVSPCPLRESAVIDTIFPVVFLTLLKNHLSSIRRFGRLVGSFGQPSVIDTQPSISWRIGCHLYKLPCRLVDTLGELAVIDTTFRSSC